MFLYTNQDVSIWLSGKQCMKTKKHIKNELNGEEIGSGGNRQSFRK